MGQASKLVGVWRDLHATLAGTARYGRVHSQHMPLYDEYNSTAEDPENENNKCAQRHENDTIGSIHTSKPWRMRSWRAALQILSIMTVAVLAVIGTVDVIRRASYAVQRHQEAHDPVQRVHDCFRSCGFTAAEAIARGCVFEEFDMRWEHPECIDTELAAEYRRMGSEPDGSWTYMVDDKSATEGVPINELRRLTVNATELSMYVGPGKVAYASMRHHLTHCIFRWRKQFRAPFVGTRWPSQLGWEENHIKHCMDVILNYRDVPLEEFKTRVVFESP